MKNTLIGRNASISLLFALGILFVVGFACGGSSTPPPAGYVGFWTGEDGSTITIRGDGSADYKSGGTSVSGGGVTVDESSKTLKITFASLGPSFTIDKPPTGDKMTLSGVVYKKGSGSDSKPDSTTSSGKLEIPSNDKLQTLVKTTMLEFNDAVQSGDFSDFHKKTATVWRDSITPDEMREAFKKMVDNKDSFNLKKAISSLDATFKPEPKIAQVVGVDALVVEGFYPTTPKKLYFTLKYTMDDGVLKLVGINIETKDQ